MVKEIEEFYNQLHLEPNKMYAVGKARHGLGKSAIELAMGYIYQDRLKFPNISLGHRIFLSAKRLDPLISEWKKRPWWKKIYQSIIFPRTTIWEYDLWHTLKK